MGSTIISQDLYGYGAQVCSFFWGGGGRVKSQHVLYSLSCIMFALVQTECIFQWRQTTIFTLPIYIYLYLPLLPNNGCVCVCVCVGGGGEHWKQVQPFVPCNIHIPFFNLNQYEQLLCAKFVAVIVPLEAKIYTHQSQDFYQISYSIK